MKQSNRIRAPKGYMFKIYRPSNYSNDVRIALCVRSTGTQIGAISLEKIVGHKYYATHSSLNYEYRNKKLGTIMYARAIQWCHDNGFGVRSSGSSSADALRVWEGKSLRRLFTLRLRNQNEYGYKRPTWYVYKKVKP